ncbi:MAG: helix-turn-helix transcriptional regulator [Oscillospiraceae bacterium]|nr:helix-turn-helix transcriptional regulator [Oscillospiraceae bacterium]
MQGTREKASRGTPDFPLNVYKFRTDTVNVTYHWHPEIELVYIEKGGFTVTINGESFEACEGDIILVNGGELHSMHRQGVEVCFRSVVFYPELLDFANKNPFQRYVLEPLKKGRLCMPRRITSEDECYQKLKKQFLRTVSARKNDFPYAEQIISLYEFLLVLYKEGLLFSSESERAERDGVEVIKQAIAYIDEHISEKITLKELADSVNMSEKYFCSFFSKKTGSTPIEFVNHLRIEKACEMLKMHKTSVTEAALETGFESLSYFIRRFKRQMGVSPSQYKKQNLKNS